MAKRKKPSKYQLEYQRVRRRINRLEKQGYTVPVKLSKSYSLKALQKEFSLEALYEKSFYVNKYGEIIPAVEERKVRRSESARKGWQTRRGEIQEQPTEQFAVYETIIFDNLESLISTIESWTPEPLWTDTVIAEKENQKNKLLELITGYRTEEEKLRIAESINQNAMEVNEIAHRIMYETYRFDLVYYQPRGYYDFSADYARLAFLIGQSGIPPMEE